MTTVELDSLSSYTLQTAGDDIIAFQTNPTEEGWNKMDASIKNTLATYDGPGNGTNPRILVSIADGTVAYWSAGRSKNTWIDFIKKTLYSDNLNTRSPAMTALLSQDGVGYGEYLSSTIGSLGTYPPISTKYTRTGFSAVKPLGLLLIVFYRAS